MANGRMPAPPHDESGHTWHHNDRVLFGITKYGLKPPYAPPNYESDMPAFAGKLSDEEIRAVLAYISSHWISAEVLAARSQPTWFPCSFSRRPQQRARNRSPCAMCTVWRTAPTASAS
jgi:hypothetical protein